MELTIERGEILLKNRKKKVLACLAMIMMLLAFGSTGCQNETDSVQDVEQSSVTENESGEMTEGITFPYVLDDGKLEITSVFQYTGMNPDCENQEGSDIASILVKNISNEYLANAEITMNASDGREFHFTVSEIPAGKAAMAFSKENASVETDSVYSDITCETIFDSDVSMQEDKISVSVEETQITLQNTTSDEISNIVVYCHSTLDDQYFGGITYTYTIQNLPANGIAKVDAVDCILSPAEVVRVTMNE